MMYRNSQPHLQISTAVLLKHRRALAIACAALLLVAVILGVFAFRSAKYQDRAKVQFVQRMYSASVSAVEEVNRLGSIVTSNASARLGRIRQYIYYMEQLNAISMSLAGGESGRLAPEDAFPALYGDLETLEELLQQSTVSTLDARSLLLTHLQSLQACLALP